MSTINELGPIGDDPSKEAETVWAIHTLQISLDTPNFNIMHFGKTYFATAFLAQKICYGIYKGNKSKSNFNSY